MKKATLMISCLLVLSNVFAQNKNKHEDDPAVVLTCTSFHATRPLSELALENPAGETKINKEEEQDDREHRKAQHFVRGVKNGGIYGNDPSQIQTTMGTVSGNRAPLTSWAGQTNGSEPLDCNGAVGLTQYVQIVNATSFKVFNKSTGAVTLTTTLGNLWTPHTTNDGDPVVLYDKAADRWFISQFGLAANNLFIAVSQTGNAAGAYYTYTFTAPAATDYPKFSVWQDGYYMTTNIGSNQRVFCFERAAMLVGNAAARMIVKSFSPPNPGSFFCPLSADAGDGTLPPAGTPCPIFSYSDNGWGGGNTDAVNIFKMAVNWVPTTPTATITSAGILPTAAFDASYNSGWNDCVQPNTTQKLDGIGGVCMFRAQYKIWSGYNSVLLNWAVKISTTQRSIKWCELRQDSTSGVWSIYQQGIYAPDASTRWMGSIAMDNNGSIGLCYMKSDATSIYPSLCYTGRRTCDPLGTFPVTEVVAAAGTGSQTIVNRDGDYASTVLDPNGVTFWHTGEYFVSGGGAQTRIYSFQIPACVTVMPTANFTTTAGTLCTNTAVSFTDASINQPTSWSWTFTGGTPATSVSANQSVTYTAPGTYPVKLVVTNSAGVDSMTTNITVNQTPTVTVNAASICRGTSANLVAHGATSYTWSAGAVSPGDSTATVTPTATTNYTVTGTSNGCPKIAIAAVSVIPFPTISNTALTQNICTGNAASFTPASNVGGSTYAWTATGSSANVTGFSATGSGVISNVLTNSSTTNQTVTYVITPTGPSPHFCVGAPVTFVVTVLPTAFAAPTITQNSTILSSSSATGNQWYLNGVAIAGGTGQNQVITANGVYTVVVTIGSCVSAPSAGLTIVNAGITDASNPYYFDVYPNPTDGNFEVSFNALEKSTYTIALYNDLGQIIYKDVLKDYSGNYSKKLNIEQYAKGIYTISLTNAKNQTVKKVIVY